MDYGTCIMNDNELIIYQFESIDSDPDNMGEEILVLPHADSLDVRSYRASLFDDAEEVIKFINHQELCMKRNYDYYFKVHAYKIVREHYIQLYYTSHVSNS